MKQLMALYLCALALGCLAGTEKETGCSLQQEDSVEIFGGFASNQGELQDDSDQWMNAEDADEDAEEEEEPAGADTNVIYKLVKGNLLDGSEGAPKPYDAKKLLNAKYYVLCFTGLEFPENRDTLKIRAVHNYNLMVKDYPGKVAFIFIPTSKVPTHLKKHLPNLKLPFPILKRQAAEKSKLNSVRGRSSQCYAVVTADGKVVSVDGKPLKVSDDPGRMFRDFMDLLDEE